MSVLGIAIFMGFYYWFCRLRFGYTFSSALLQPVTIAVFVGLITGEMATSMKIGAGLQLVYMGVTSTPGGNVPSDPALAGCIAIPLGVAAGMNAETAIALAVPFGVLGVFVDQLRRSTNAIWVHMADRCAEKADTNGILRAAFLYPAIAGFIIRFPIVFIIDYFGVNAAQKLIEILPEWLSHSFEVMGGILPALGFAITLTVIGKKSLIPFFIIGFFAVLYLNLGTMAVAIFAVCFALLLNLFKLKEEEA
ncbi:MAG: PTS sugar transporter subunit IIC [Clostridiales bacterium]|nr:PTS sugar transporter subunit IIC [Clostridiales bacterium]